MSKSFKISLVILIIITAVLIYLFTGPLSNVLIRGPHDFPRAEQLLLVGEFREPGQVPKVRLLGEGETIGYYVIMEKVDYKRLYLRDNNGKDYSFFLATTVDNDLLWNLELNKNYANKKLRVIWYKMTTALRGEVSPESILLVATKLEALE